MEGRGSALITKEIKDPTILKAISKHHARGTLLRENKGQEGFESSNEPVDEPDLDEVEKSGSHSLSFLVLLFIFGFFIFILLVGLFA